MCVISICGIIRSILQLMKNKSFYFYLFIVLALLPVLLLRDYTPSNELRYLSIADEALRNGTFFAFTNHGLPYADKPPFYIWIIMLCKFLLGRHCMLLLSLFSLVPAFVITHTMDRWVANLVDERYRNAGRWMLMSCGFFLGAAIVLRMDMLMCMFITLALYQFYQWRMGGRGSRSSWLFPFYVFMALFTKGPVGILVPLLGTFFYSLLADRRLRSFRLCWGWKTWSILLGLCAIWFGCVYWEGGNAYLNNLLFHQTIDRAVDSFHHDAPFYFYLLAVWYSFAPYSLLMVVGLLVSLRRSGKSELERFFLVIIAVTFVMLSLISSKIAIYLLPAYPFWVYAVVLSLPHWRWNHWLAFSLAFPAFVFVCTSPMLFWLSGKEGSAFLGEPFFLAGGVLLSFTGCLCLYFLYKMKQLENAIGVLAAGLFLAVFVGGWSIPEVNSRIGYADLCREAIQMAQEKQASDYCTWKISRPENMDVYLGEEVKKTTWEELVSGNLQKTVLMLPVKEFRKLEAEAGVEYENYKIVGKYVIVYVG